MPIPQIINYISIIVFGTVLIAATVSDVKTRTIPDYLCGLIMLVSVVHILCGGIWWATAAISCVAVAAVALILSLIKDNFLGGGDVKLCGAVAFFSGAEIFLFAVSIGLTIAAVICLIKKMRYKKNISLPLAPYLTIGYGAYYLITILRSVT